MFKCDGGARDAAAVHVQVEVDAASSAALSSHEAAWACVANDADLRVAGLTCLTAARRLSAPVPVLEMQVLRQVLGHSLKVHHA